MEKINLLTKDFLKVNIMVDTVAGQAVDLINRIGIFDVIVRFILGFGITFGMLEKTGILGKNMQKINALIAVSVGIIAVLAF
ncbi:Uncharacterised protein [Candidatus Tiddalikarchaeum anstoanum]|nr:Uncharacterised protein [Candidatus Tiddalikarchaeum anstoanum]